MIEKSSISQTTPERYVRRLEWLRDVSQRLAATRSLSEVLDVVYSTVHDGLGYDRVGIDIFDHEAGVYEELLGTDAEGNKFIPSDRRMDLTPESPFWRIPGNSDLLQGSSYYYSEDVAAEFPPDLRYLLDGAPKHNITVPLRIDDRVSGMLSVDNLTSGRPISLGEVDPLLSLATYVGRAIENARLQEALRESEARFRAIYESAAIGIATSDENGRIVAANPAYQRIVGYTEDELRGMHWADLTHPDDREQQERFLAQINRVGPGVGRLEKRYVRKDGTIVWASLNLAPLRTDDQGQRYHLATVEDISDQKQLEARLVRQALYDDLTDLPNRAMLIDRAGQAINLARKDGAPLALLLLNVNRLTLINETFGHAAGDRALVEVGRRLQQSLRRSDTVARLAGDVFAILLDGTDVSGIHRVIDVLRHDLEEPYSIEDHSLYLGGRFGVAIFPDHGTEFHTLLRRADIALGRAKERGTFLEIYDATQDHDATSRLTLLGDLRRALESDELTLHYQPQIQLGPRRLWGFEALVRWAHPTRGWISPGDFIELAETSGLIKQLTTWILHAAFAQCAAWQRAGTPHRIAINLSTRDLNDAALVDTITRAVDRWAVDPTQMALEITETSLMLTPTVTMDVVTRLHELGFRISIDDFGTGYSSLGYLRRLPVDELKIDKSFILDLTGNREDETIVTAVIELGHKLGLEVVAEGVETEPALELLESYGCDLAQGFFIGRPMSAEQVSSWVDASA